ncbi:MAG: hypothetical protein ACP5OU_07290 [Methanothrix sp.]
MDGGKMNGICIEDFRFCKNYHLYQNRRFIIDKFPAVLILLLLLISSQILVEAGRGELNPISSRDKCNQIIGYKDDDRDALIREVLFNYTNDKAVDCSLSNYDTVRYIVTLGDNIREGTMCEFFLKYPQENPMPDILLKLENPLDKDKLINYKYFIINKSVIENKKIIFDINLLNYEGFLGECNNTFGFTGGEGGQLISLGGPFVMINYGTMNITTYDNRTIDNVTIPIRASNPTNFDIEIDRKDNPPYLPKKPISYIMSNYGAYVDLQWHVEESIRRDEFKSVTPRPSSIG